MDMRVGDLVLLLSLGLVMMVSKFLKRSLLNLGRSLLVRNCEKLLILSQSASFSDFLPLALARMAFFY